MDKINFKEAWKKEWNIWQFKLLLIASVLLVLVWGLSQKLDIKNLSSLTLPFVLRELTLLLFIVSFSIYSFTYKDQKTFFHKIESLYIVLLLAIFFILYLVVLFKSLDVKVLILVLSILIILFLSAIYGFINMKRSNTILSVIASYIIFAFDTIILFGFIFALVGAFSPNALMENGTKVANAWEMVYFSSGNFYTMGYGDIVPVGWLMKLTSIIEIVLAAIIHIIVLGYFLSSISNRRDKEIELKKVFHGNEKR